MLVGRGEVREFGLTGLTRNQVSLTAPGVRIPPSPPHSLACFPTFWISDEIGAWGAIHTRRWTWRMPPAASERKNRAKFSVRDFGMSICEPASSGRTPDASNYARVSLSGFQSLLLPTPERGQFDSLGHRYSAEVCGLPAFDDRLDDPGRQKRQPHHAPHVSVSNSNSRGGWGLK